MSVTFESAQDLISAHRVRLGQAALKLGRGVPEIGQDRWEYLKSLSRSLTTEQRDLRRRLLGKAGGGKLAAKPATPSGMEGFSPIRRMP